MLCFLSIGEISLKIGSIDPVKFPIKSQTYKMYEVKKRLKLCISLCRNFSVEDKVYNLKKPKLQTRGINEGVLG